MRILFQPDSTAFQPVYDAQPSIWHTMSNALQTSVTNVLRLLVSFLPGLFALILSIALLTAFGILLSFLLRKALTAARFDERFAERRIPGIADWSPAHSPTALAGRIAFWACVLLGLLIGILSFDASYATGSVLTLSLLPYLTHSVGAILILVAGNLIARYLARTVLIGAVNNGLQYARFLSLGVKWLVLVLTAAMALDHIQLGGTVVALAFGILFGGIVLTLALAIGLGSRDLVARSIQRTEARTPTPFPTPMPRTGSDPEPTLRHF